MHRVAGPGPRLEAHGGCAAGGSIRGQEDDVVPVPNLLACFGREGRARQGKAG